MQVVRGVVYVLAIALSLAGGYALTCLAWPDPTERMVRELTVAEHLDEYLEVGSFEFLSQLAHSKEFGSKAQ